MVFLTKSPTYDIYERLSRYPKYESFMRDYKTFISPYHCKEHPEKYFEHLVTSIGFQTKHCEIRDQLFVYDNIHQLRSELVRDNFQVPLAIMEISLQMCCGRSTHFSSECLIVSKMSSSTIISSWPSPSPNAALTMRVQKFSRPIS